VTICTPFGVLITPGPFQISLVSCARAVPERSRFLRIYSLPAGASVMQHDCVFTQDADQSVKNAVTTSISNAGVLTIGTSEVPKF